MHTTHSRPNTQYKNGSKPGARPIQYSPQDLDPDCGGVAAAHYGEWARLEKRVIDNAAKQWRKRLCACVAANSGHFDHLL